MADSQILYQQYQQVLAGEPLPAAVVDLDRFDQNTRDLAARSGQKSIRIASKSVRCVELLRRALAHSPQYQGLMTFTLRETAWLAQQGFDDFVLGYPIFQASDVRLACELVRAGKTLRLMVDLPQHVQQLSRIAQAEGVVLPICLDLDCSMPLPGLHFGVRRSSVRTPAQALKLWELIRTLPGVRLEAVMGYEAQIAGLTDNIPGQAAMNAVVRWLKSRSIRQVALRREAVVTALRQAGAPITLVNGGGTGSLESTRLEAVVTEVTVGSGLYSSWLFDGYRAFRHQPAAFFAIEVTRQPLPDVVTCAGGGYVASGAVGWDKVPKPYLPAGGKLLPTEGTGEVQTPIQFASGPMPEIGSPILLRHAKAGELCERFNELLLVSGSQLVGHTPTYRGQGQCFL